MMTGYCFLAHAFRKRTPSGAEQDIIQAPLRDNPNLVDVAANRLQELAKAVPTQAITQANASERLPQCSRDLRDFGDLGV